MGTKCTGMLMCTIAKVTDGRGSRSGRLIPATVHPHFPGRLGCLEGGRLEDCEARGPPLLGGDEAVVDGHEDRVEAGGQGRARAGADQVRCGNALHKRGRGMNEEQVEYGVGQAEVRGCN